MSPQAIVGARWSRVAVVSGFVLMGAACSDPAPPEPEVSSIELSVPLTGTAIRFRDPLVVRAAPLAALGVPLERTVTWTPLTPALLTVQALGAHGDSARIRAAGVGTSQVRVSAGSVTQTFDVTVLDTVFSVTLTANAQALVVGDTFSFTAAVPGSSGSDKGLHWEPLNADAQAVLPSSNPLIFRVQVLKTGVIGVRATAFADVTKTDVASVTVQPAKLAFLTQPSTSYPRVRFATAPRVAVQDLNGVTSIRSVSAITLAAEGCQAEVSGATEIASSGVASFPRAALGNRCASAALRATASPPVPGAISQSFAIVPRTCDVLVPVARVDTVHAVLENTDCVVMRSGGAAFAHTYTVDVPDSTSTPLWRFFLPALGFTPRVDSYFWPDNPTVFWADTSGANGELVGWYALRPGTYRLVVTSMESGGTGPYSLHTGRLAGSPRTACVVLTMPGVSFRDEVVSGCAPDFASRPGRPTSGKQAVLFLPAGKSVDVAMSQDGGDVIVNSYLEVFDVTSGVPTFIVHDDDSGGGMDARLTIAAASTSRFIEIRAGNTLFPGRGNYRLTISP